MTARQRQVVTRLGKKVMLLGRVVRIALRGMFSVLLPRHLARA